MAPQSSKNKNRWVSNQEDTLKSNISDFVQNHSSLEIKKQRDHSSPSDLSLSANPKINNLVKSVSSKNKLGPRASKFGNFVLNNITKNINVSDSDSKSKSERKDVVFHNIKALGKKFKRRNRFVVSTCERQMTNHVRVMKTNIANKLIDGSIYHNNLSKVKSHDDELVDLDAYLLNNEENKDNPFSLDSHRYSENIQDSYSDSHNTKEKNTSPLDANNKRRGFRVKGTRLILICLENHVQTSKMALAEHEIHRKSHKVLSEGDAVFLKVLNTTKYSKVLATKYAAEYYNLAFRNSKTFHFEDGTFIKSVYFARSHPYMQEMITYV